MIPFGRFTQQSLALCSRLLSRVPTPLRRVSSEPTSGTTSGTTAASSRWRSYVELGKPRLASLVGLTTGFGYALSERGVSSGEDWALLGTTVVGTLGVIAGANGLNQAYERFTDAQMSRTQGRPVPTHRIGGFATVAFSFVSAGIGAAILYAGSKEPPEALQPAQTCIWNTGRWLPAVMALGNMALYASVYTIMKRLHPANTWVGAVVGAVPPLIGWAAADGALPNPSTAAALFGLLYLWQIPHFLALAWLLRKDYALVGYRMISLTNPAATPALAYAHTLPLLPFGYYCHHVAGITSSYFIWDAALAALPFAYAAHKFTRRPDHTSALRLFKASLFYLPVVLVCMLAHRVWPEKSERSVVDGSADASAPSSQIAPSVDPKSGTKSASDLVLPVTAGQEERSLEKATSDAEKK